MRVCEMIRDPETSASDIGSVISEDPALTMRLLKIVNSPFYGFPSKIDTVSRAITIVGTLELLDLVLATAVVKTFSGLPSELVTMDVFWRHSLSCGVIARGLAGHRKEKNVERFFIAGLLHDIGALLLYSQAPDEARQALAHAQQENLPIEQAERQVLGFDHAEVGGELAASWMLPPFLKETIQFHHQPERCTEFLAETTTIHLANHLSFLCHPPATGLQTPPQLNSNAWELLALEPTIQPDLLEQAEQQFKDAEVLILG